MKKIKTIVDREPLGSDYITSRQNFSQVIKQANQMAAPTWKSAWFYGPIGLAVIAVTVSVVSMNPSSAEPNAASNSLSLPESENSTDERLTLADNYTDDHVRPTESSNEPMSMQEGMPEPPESVHSQSVDMVTLERPVTTETPEPAANQNTAPTNKGAFVHIGPYYMGDIPVSALGEALECNDDIRIIAFNIHFNTLNGTETASIIGNKIPSKIIEAIKRHNIGYMITFTDIKGKTKEGKVVSLLPMNFQATNLK
jgi:hypothetical protein